MKDNQKKYLDKVVEFLVRGTRIDYEKDEIQFPFSLSSTFVLSYRLPSSYPPFFLLLFSKYCKDVYGLTDQEIEYVWNQYRTIILDKITNK